MQIKTKGIILKELANGDEDKLLTILTEDRGVIFAYAKGARRFKNPLAPSTGLLCYSSMILFWNRERYSLDHADSIEQFFGLRQSMEKLALASYFAEVSTVLGPRENDDGQFLLRVQAAAVLRQIGCFFIRIMALSTAKIAVQIKKEYIFL